MQPYFSAIPCSVSDWSKLWRMKTSLFRTWLQVLPYFFNWRAESRIDCRSSNKLSFSIIYVCCCCCCCRPLLILRRELSAQTKKKKKNDDDELRRRRRRRRSQENEKWKTNNIYTMCVGCRLHYVIQYTSQFNVRKRNEKKIDSPVANSIKNRPRRSREKHSFFFSIHIRQMRNPFSKFACNRKFTF